jgi:uncharacterized membrane protein YbhN (UPF0104 family)
VVGAMPFFRILEKMGWVWLRGPLLVTGAIGLVIGILVVYRLSWLKNLLPSERARAVLGALDGRFNRFGFVVKMTGLSVAFHAISILLYWLLARSLGVIVPWATLLLGVPLITLFSLIPSSLGALGVREAGITTFFIALGVTPPEAFSIALLARGITYTNTLLGGLIYLVYE